MGLPHPLSARFGPDILPDRDIYGFGGCEESSARIWSLRYALPRSALYMEGRLQYRQKAVF